MSGNRDAFEEAIWQSARFWRGKTAAGGDRGPRRVLVDMLVDHPVYYLTNLIVAKYLELTRGLKPWALVSSAEDTKIVVLAKSFGIEDFTFVRDEVTREAKPEVAPFLKAFEGLEGEALRKRVLGLGINGIPVGDLLYDTYVREVRQITIRRVDDDLRAYTALMLNYRALNERLLDEVDVGAVVIGHLVYLRFGLIARQAVQRGAEVFMPFGGKGVRIQRRRDIAGVSDVMSRITPAMVDGALAAEGAAAVEAGRRTLVQRMEGAGNEFAFLNEEGYAPDRPLPEVTEFERRFGLRPGKPRGLVMLHAFPDANHSIPGLLFDDFYDWFVRTLEIARDQSGIDWLFKMHPHDAYYTDDTEPQALLATAAAACPHIRVVPDGFNTAIFPKVADFLVTVNGRAGLEFAGLGVPPVVGARGFFAGLGFTEEPGSLEAYAEVLRRGGDLRLDAGQRDRALVAVDFYFRRLIVDCLFQPDVPYNFWKTYDEGFFWKSYADTLASSAVEDDPLFRAIERMVETGADTMFRPD